MRDGATRGRLDARQIDALRRRLGGLAWILDQSIRIPLVGWRIGVDALLGLIPGAGDAIGALLSSYFLLQASRLGASRAVLARMAGNVAIDALLGAVPLLGDLFDMAWKANLRNVRLIEKLIEEPRRAERSSRLFLATLVGALALLMLACLALGFALARWLLRAG